MPTVTDTFSLPTRADLTAMGFVVRLQDDAASARKLVDDYVVTPTVARELPEIFARLETTVARTEDYGRFVHGSFGSGKSHFMGILGLLLEDADLAWNKDHPLFHALADHRGWVRKTRPLVVRVHMISARGRASGLDDVLYRAFNEAMKRHGKPASSFRDATRVIREAREEAATYGAAFYRQLEENGITDRAGFDALETASPEEQEDFAREWLKLKNRDTDVLDLQWGQGLHRMARHAKEQGFGCLVFLVDELLLWLGEKDAHQFRAEINNLNTVVDHATGTRAVPVAVFVARQRRLSEFFPELTSEDGVYEYIDHHSKRFELTTLEDVELRHIVHGRVLKVRPGREGDLAQARDRIADKHAKVLQGVLAGVDGAYLRDVFPFHPALVEMLVDVSALLQRERSALTLLYELLVVHYPELPLGEFLPVGSAFEAIFPKHGLVESSRKRGELQRIHEAYWMRLGPALARLQLSDERRKIVDQVVKTALLAEISPRLQRSGRTVERLVQLNSADTDGELNRGLYSEVYTDLVELQRRVPGDLQITGNGKTAEVRIDLGSVNFGELLQRARSKVDNANTRLTTFYDVLKQSLGLSSEATFKEKDANAGPYKVAWRNTDRRGFVKLGNVRTVPTDDLLCQEDFRIVVDYPWDEIGFSVEDDRQRAANVKRKHGSQYTVCWLPRHFTPDELAVVTEVAAARHLMSAEGQEDLLMNLGAADRATVEDRAKAHEQQMRNRLSGILIAAYRDNAECFPLQSDMTIDSKAFPELGDVLDHIAFRLMDRRWPMHPEFLAKPDRRRLDTLLQWMVGASDAQGHSVHFDDATVDVLRKIAKPLEVVGIGQTRAELKLMDSRYFKWVIERTDRASVEWEPVAEHLAVEFGFGREVRDLFLSFLCHARGFRALNASTGEPVEVGIGKPAASVRVKLERARLLDHAAWSRVRELGPLLLGIETPAAHRSLGAQDQVIPILERAAVERRGALGAVHEGVVQLGGADTPRTRELQQAMARLAPLVGKSDSFDRLTTWLAAWPDTSDDPVRRVVNTVDRIRTALGALDRNAREHLDAAVAHPEHGDAIRAHVEHLTRWLGSEERVEPLAADAVKRWNDTAHGLLRKLVSRPVPPPVAPPVSPPPTPPTPPIPKGVTFTSEVDLTDGDALGEWLGEVRRKLRDSGRGRVKLSVVIEEDR